MRNITQERKKERWHDIFFLYITGNKNSRALCQWQRPTYDFVPKHPWTRIVHEGHVGDVFLSCLPLSALIHV